MSDTYAPSAAFAANAHADKAKYDEMYAASIADGRLVANIDSVFMTPTDYSVYSPRN